MPTRWIALAFIALIGAQAHAVQKRRGTAHRVAQNPSLSVDISVINNPGQPDLPLGAKGSPVVRAEILLVDLEAPEEHPTQRGGGVGDRGL